MALFDGDILAWPRPGAGPAPRARAACLPAHACALQLRERSPDELHRHRAYPAAAGTGGDAACRAVGTGVVAGAVAGGARTGAAAASAASAAAAVGRPAAADEHMEDAPSASASPARACAAAGQGARRGVRRARGAGGEGAQRKRHRRDLASSTCGDWRACEPVAPPAPRAAMTTPDGADARAQCSLPAAIAETKEPGGAAGIRAESFELLELGDLGLLRGPALRSGPLQRGDWSELSDGDCRAGDLMDMEL